MICFGTVPSGAVLPVFFSTYGKTNGESITLTGLAVTDIEIYKGTSVTQRASDAGYALIDTDGIDVDSLTGVHGFSIDTSDNTDAGFYAVGSFFTVVVSAVTVDAETVNFIAATFRLGPAEASAGYSPVTLKVGTGTGEVNLSSGKAPATIAVGDIADNAITDAKVASDVTIASVTGAVGSVTGNVGGNVTGSVGSLAAQAKADVNAEVVDAVSVDVMADSVATDGSRPTMRQALLMITRFLMERSVSSTTMTVTKEDGTTSSMTFTLDSATAPTSITRAS